MRKLTIKIALTVVFLMTASAAVAKNGFEFYGFYEDAGFANIEPSQLLQLFSRGALSITLYNHNGKFVGSFSVIVLPTYDAVSLEGVIV